MSFFTETVNLRVTPNQKQWLEAHVAGFPELWDSEADVVRSAIQHFMICHKGVTHLTKVGGRKDDERTRESGT